MVEIKFNVQKVRQTLAQNGIEFYSYAQIDSTNSQAKRMAHQLATLTHPIVLVANHQTNGYGRLDRSFYSPEDDGLYISFLIPVSQNDFNPGLLTTMTAVASLETLEQFFSVKLQIKWVNDLIYRKRKVGGILAEAVTDATTHKVTGVVIGIGVNLTTQKFPEEISQIAVALSNQVPNKDETEFIRAFVDNFFHHLTTYQTADFMTTYRKHSSVIGHRVRVQFQTKVVTGTVLDVADNGALVVQTDRTILHMTSGEIIHVRPIESV
ncbi:biotin--[acetyl-CoA-carboxylase] ligase [Pediococcus cellicola]|uniref:biotin--[biotin carboxyl-carrier protein] ligase n=1 Tax=Pediococcus cellicola TaxID=319652 RepID=A0A0R2IZ43_9LACO|nr:biotin--[acetyl-CoA-carboxylase] ligase [Pediococcus cellicola]KRN67287.1 biotin--[acetyl-coa-carboxylase] ligase and biotin operon repressor [Pediococcus cellicola]GEL14931.1 bifunctional ligase/repressor BirA [Pediococcus cellicola]